MSHEGRQVFVQLGRMPEYGPPFMSKATRVSHGTHTVLITDQGRDRAPSGIDVVPFASVVARPELEQLRRAMAAGPYDLNWRRGYWLWVFARFLALRNYCARDQSRGFVVHLECDVATYCTPVMVEEELGRTDTACAMPFIDDDTACPGIVLARSAKDMAELCDAVVQDALGRSGRSDMQALAHVRRGGGLAALPTRSAEAGQAMPVTLLGALGTRTPVESALVAFDAAAAGQYLFGIDPRNNGGVLVPGYRETRGGIDPGQWTNWTVCLAEDGVSRLAFRDEGVLVVLANLHVHAKIAIPDPSVDSPQWRSWLAVANGMEGARPVVSRSLLVRDDVRRLTYRSRHLMRGIRDRLRGGSH